MRRVTTTTLVKIVKKKKGDFEGYAFGAYLERSTGYSIDELRIKTVHDRLSLSKQFLEDANSALDSTPPRNRSAISRAYYSLYHAARAVAFFMHRGDDYQEHAVLPTKLPIDFPDHAIWQNDLSAARLDRNEADYEPYPKGDKPFRAAALKYIDLATTFLPMAKRYLYQKGCRI